MTVLDDIDRSIVDRFVELLSSMSFDDPDVRPWYGPKSIAFTGSADGGSVVVKCDGRVVSWDLASTDRAPRWTQPVPNQAYTTSLLVSPDGSRVVAPTGNSLQLLDGATGELIRESPGVAINVAFSPDGTVLAAVSWPGDVTLFDADDLTVIKTLEPNGGAANDGGLPDQGSPALALSPDNGYLAVWHWGSGVEVWNVESGESIVVQTFSTEGGSGFHRALGTQWSLGDDTLTETACRIVGRDLTEDEWTKCSQLGPDPASTSTTGSKRPRRTTIPSNLRSRTTGETTTGFPATSPALGPAREPGAPRCRETPGTSVGLGRFELPTSCPPDKRANQAAPQPVCMWSGNSIEPRRSSSQVEPSLMLLCQGGCEVLNEEAVEAAETLVSGLRDDSVCEFDDGTDVPVATMRRLACDAHILPVVLGGDGVVLDVGRSRRLATDDQRRALRAMYRTCGIGTCDVSFDRCEIHHVDEWDAHQGDTDL